jgi:hypothetical protein
MWHVVSLLNLNRDTKIEEICIHDKIFFWVIFRFQCSVYVSVVDILVLGVWKFKIDIKQFRFTMTRRAEDEQTSLLTERPGFQVSYSSVAYVSIVLYPVGGCPWRRTPNLNDYTVFHK